MLAAGAIASALLGCSLRDLDDLTVADPRERETMAAVDPLDQPPGVADGGGLVEVGADSVAPDATTSFQPGEPIAADPRDPKGPADPKEDPKNDPREPDAGPGKPDDPDPHEPADPREPDAGQRALPADAGVECTPGSSPEVCDDSARELCSIKGASCEIVYSRRCRRTSTCRWPSVADEAQCGLSSLGHWWAVDSSVALDHPGLVLDGRSGACTRFVSAVRCGLQFRMFCAEFGASCDIVRTSEGASSNLCRWNAASDEASCAQTAGIWTTAESPFAVNHPGTVAPAVSGACVTQAQNLLPE